MSRRSFNVTVGFAVEANSDADASEKVEAVVERIRADLGIVDAFVDGVFDTDEDPDAAEREEEP